MPKGKDAISVIIPTLNETDHLPSTLRAAEQDGVQLIVVDGGSSDGTQELAASFDVDLFSCRACRADQLNLGAEVASGDILLFLHADTLLPQGYSQEIHKALSDKGVVAGAFRLSIQARGGGFRAIETVANLRSRWLGLTYGDQALFLRKSDFNRMGGFSPWPILEDLDLVRRIRKRGRVSVSPKAVVTSGRRWLQVGLLRTTMLNQLILVAFRLGVSPRRLARLYRTASIRSLLQSVEP